MLQCTVNRYEVGHGIPAHVDSHECCDQTLASLSLVSDVVSTKKLGCFGVKIASCWVWVRESKI